MIDFRGYGPRLLEGALVTLEVALLSLILAIVLGLLTASAKLSPNRFVHGIGTLYTTLIRSVPDLILMLLLYFGGQLMVNRLTDALGLGYVDINAFVAGVVTIGLIFGAYMGETFRGAFQSVEEGQMEAARAYGMSSWLAFRRVRFPLMMRHALPGLGNNWMVLLKTTALVSVIGLTDMVRVADEATKSTHEPFLFMLPVAGIYLLITTLSEWIFLWLTRRYNAGFRGADQ